MIYLRLAYEFFKIGLFAIGGGMATIPFLMDLSHKYNWYSVSELSNMIAVSESTPGPVGINMATYVGYQVGGIPGGIIATLAEVAPAIIIIAIVAKFMEKFKDHKLVKSAFLGIRPAVAALIGYTVLELIKISISFNLKAFLQFSYLNLFIILVFLGLMYLPKLKKLHPVAWIAMGAVIGIVLKL
ncbi:MAG: chromate transporter [Lachnospiraceae bacterium]|nr:chromate transporter [Lachnospiraceae bacterium]